MIDCVAANPLPPVDRFVRAGAGLGDVARRSVLRHARSRRAWIAQCRAFSLIELTVALGISGILLVAVGSSILLASYAIPQPDSPYARTIQAHGALEQLATDLQHAQRIITLEPHELVFTVADRTGDGSVQTIRYSFSGTPGDPLMRQVDQHRSYAVIESVRSIDFTYHTVEQSHTYRGNRSLAPQQTLSSDVTLLTLSAFRVDADHYTGQLVRPKFGPDVVSWWVTRGDFYARRASSSPPTLYARVRPATPDGTPGTPVLDQAVAEIAGSLLSYPRNEIHFTDQPALKPGMPINITFEQPDGSSASADFAYRSLSMMRMRGGLVSSNSAGSSWNMHNHHVMQHAIYGRAIVEGQPNAANQIRVARIDVLVELDYPEVAPLRTSINPALTLPVLSVFWELDFRRDPTTIDRSGDGLPDWQVLGGGTFDSGDLTHGTWQANQRLIIDTDYRFGAQTRLLLNVQHHTGGGSDSGAFAQLNVHHSNGLIAPLYLVFRRESSSTRAIQLYNAAQGDTEDLLISIENLPIRAYDIQLFVDADNQTVNLHVDGIDFGTFYYERVADDSLPTGLTIGSLLDNGHAQFHYVRLESGPQP